MKEKDEPTDVLDFKNTAPTKDVAQAGSTKDVVQVSGGRALYVNLDNLSSMPDLDEAEAMPLDLTSLYWTPEAPGETKKLIYDGMEVRDLIDQESGEAKELPHIFFFEQSKNADGTKTVARICNATKRLLGVFENGSWPRGSAFQITYLGKVKNGSNAYKSDSWRVSPLVVKIA